MKYHVRSSPLPAAWLLLLPAVSIGQTRIETPALDSVLTVAGESRVLAWPVPLGRPASITSITTSPPIEFPPIAELVDLDGSPGVRVSLPPATPPGEYRVELAGRNQDGRPLAATISLTVSPITFPKPINGRNPVILLNGFQLICTDSDSTLAASVGTFGQMASLLQADGAPVAFFNNCSYGDIRIEQVAAQLNLYIAGLTYTDGSAVTQVDIVAHSMGGLIARAYLAGLQADGSLLPPQSPRVGRVVLISTPNYGSFQAPRVGTQAPEMVPGSTFLWGLATWNQGQDDLRGVDTLAIIGNAGSYYSAGNLDDGVVSLTSGSLGFARSDQRTRVVPYCHITPGITTVFGTVGMVCTGAQGIADIDKPSHQTAQIVRSFLSGTSDWTSIGESPSQQPRWSQYGGVYFAVENAAGTQYYNDLTQVLLGSVALNNGGAANAVFYDEFIKGTGTFQFTSSSLGTVSCGSFTTPAGYYIADRCKYGPRISRVTPLMSNLFGSFIQSGGNITIQGTGFGPQCSSCRVVASPGNISLAISAWSDQSITVFLPTSLSGLVQLAVQATGGGSDTISIMTAVSATILLANSQIQFSYAAGGSPPPPQFIAISNAGGGTLTWSAAPNAAWITTSATPSTLTVSVNPTGLAAGVHQGSISITSSGASNSPRSISVTLTVTASTQGPFIRSVVNAFGGSATIAPNTWVIVQGSALAQGSRTWQGSDFAGNQMPVALDGVSVSMNGRPTYLYYISPSQLNVLTPPDLAPGTIQVVVKNNGAASGSFVIQAQQDSPSFFMFDASHVAARHVDGSILAPANLYPGVSTPAKPGEIVILYANGFGPTSVPIVSGSTVQSGNLPALPVIRIGGISATVQFAGLVSPGLYQFNVVVPPAVAAGDNALTATYDGVSTQAGVYLAISSGATGNSGFVLYGVDAGSSGGFSTLYQIDAATGQTHRIGDIPYQPVSDIALTPDGQLYAIYQPATFFGFGGNASLLRVNPLTAATTKVGDLGFGSVTSLDSDTDGTLYAATRDAKFLRIDKATGKATLVGALGSGYAASGDLAFDSNGALYASIIGDGSDRLALVDKRTGASSIVGDIGFPQVYGLAFLPDGTMIGTANGEGPVASLIQIDKTTGRGRAIANINGASGIYGLAGGLRSWSAGLTLLDQVISRSVDSSACAVPPSNTSFSSRDSDAYLWFDVANARMGDLVSAVWKAPNGNGQSTTTWNAVSEDGYQCFWAWLNIANNSPAQLPGPWKVEVTWNGSQLFSLPFTITVQ